MYYLFQSVQIKRVYLKNRFISGSERVISDILVTSNTLTIEGFLVVVHIEKVFDLVNHYFLLKII